MAWRASRYSSAQIEPPGLVLLFAFVTFILKSSLLCWSGQPWSISLAGLAEGPAATHKSLFRARRGWGGLGEAGECKAFEKLLPFWNS